MTSYKTLDFARGGLLFCDVVHSEETCVLTELQLLRDLSSKDRKAAGSKVDCRGMERW